MDLEMERLWQLQNNYPTLIWIKNEYSSIPSLFHDTLVPFSLSQVFAIELTSHLCLQYALPKSLSVARLAINVMSSLITGEECFFDN